MTTALASLASGRPVQSTVGMTGEVTLQGRVLPIGGVKQKLLAAHRAGLTDVIIPKRNEPDLDDLPESVRRELRVHPVADVAEVLELALEPASAVAPGRLTGPAGDVAKAAFGATQSQRTPLSLRRRRADGAGSSVPRGSGTTADAPASTPDGRGLPSVRLAGRGGLMTRTIDRDVTTLRAAVRRGAAPGRRGVRRGPVGVERRHRPAARRHRRGAPARTTSPPRCGTPRTPGSRSPSRAAATATGAPPSPRAV